MCCAEVDWTHRRGKASKSSASLESTHAERAWNSPQIFTNDLFPCVLCSVNEEVLVSHCDLPKTSRGSVLHEHERPLVTLREVTHSAISSPPATLYVGEKAKIHCEFRKLVCFCRC
jgi:hypothetical protein